jgi:hypothetical protein
MLSSAKYWASERWEQFQDCWSRTWFDQWARGQGLTLLRFLAESRFNLLYALSLLTLGAGARRYNNREYCMLDRSSYFDCLEERDKGLIMGFDLSMATDVVWITYVGVFTVVNFFVLLWCGFQTGALGEPKLENMGVVEITDLALCFKFNRVYNSKVMSTVRIANAASFVLMALFYEERLIPARSTLEEKVDDAMKRLPAIITALTGLLNLHHANHRLASAKYAVFKEEVGAAHSKFLYTDLLKSSTALLKGRLANDAVKDVCEASEEAPSA